ncbi:MAG: hypothetical protein Q9209_001316 [Squamulea sp. 1 TL-2023]
MAGDYKDPLGSSKIKKPLMRTEVYWIAIKQLFDIVRGIDVLRKLLKVKEPICRQQHSSMRSRKCSLRFGVFKGELALHQVLVNGFSNNATTPGVSIQFCFQIRQVSRTNIARRSIYRLELLLKAWHVYQFLEGRELQTLMRTNFDTIRLSRGFIDAYFDLVFF